MMEIYGNFCLNQKHLNIYKVKYEEKQTIYMDLHKEQR